MATVDTNVKRKICYHLMFFLELQSLLSGILNDFDYILLEYTVV